VSDVTRILNSCSPEDPKAAAELLPLVYEELRKLAASKMANEKPGQTIQATALVHEAWLKISGTNEMEWKNRRHFFATAAEAMKRILIDRARRKSREKHGGDLQQTEFDDLLILDEMPSEELLALGDALNELKEMDPASSELIHLRYFAGFSQVAAAECLGISRSAADRNWVFARAWLYHRIRRDLAS